VTALTGSAQPSQDPRMRPVPWQRMAWVTWRQHRLMLAGVVAVLGAVGLYLLKTGLDIHHAFAVVTANCPPRCNSRQQAFGILATQYSSGMPGMILIAGLLQVVPALIGTFAGAPVLAREFEAGTFRYTWTQGFGRARWAAAKLALLAAAVVVVAGAFSLVFSWCYGPIIGLPRYSALGSTTFDLRGVVLAAWTLAAFAIGALAGVLIRQVVPSMAATLATWTGLALATGLYLRRHYAAPLVTGGHNVAPSAWVISQWWTRGMQFTSYQPASRFWTFQFIEGGWLLALSLLLIATTVWLVRRRAA
jgi:ABC-type transport system involved in multi-copper enzyme maturation permease subunit